ncbi:MAG: hypothetical protein ACYTGG_07770 [Planctomycetota bacterium]|jgi:hypothetical protein
MIRMLFILSLLVMLVPSSAPAAALQQPTGLAPRQAMRQVEFLAGRWTGEGWIRLGPDGRLTFRGTEIVQKKLGGTILLIEGEHRASMPGAEADATIHHALAVVSWDQASGTYRFRSRLADGRQGDYEASVENGKLEWSMTVPGRGRMRCTIRLDDAGHWHEIGEINPPGTDAWHQVFEMTLERVTE